MASSAASSRILPLDRQQRRLGRLDRSRPGEERKGAFGFNAAKEEFEDMIKAGIVDPTKVVRTGLQNAASVAGMLLTTEALIAEKPEEKSAAPGMPPGGMGGTM